MLEKLVVGYDGSEESRDALAFARTLGKEAGATVVAGLARRDRGRAPQISMDAGVELRDLGDRRAATALRELADSEGADAIVLGSTHRGRTGRIYPGSVAETLLRDAPCPVAIAPRCYADAGHSGIRVIAVAFDGSEESVRALDFAGELARTSRGTVRVLAVHEPISQATALGAPMGGLDQGAVTQREALRKRLDEAVAALPSELRALGRLLQGNAAERLVAETELGVDLLVMGSRGLGRVGRALLGSVANEVIRTAFCPVLVTQRASAPLAPPEPAATAAA